MHATPTNCLRGTAVAQRLGVDPSTLYRWVKQGAFPAPVRQSTRRVFWHVDVVNKWVHDNTPPAT